MGVVSCGTTMLDQAVFENIGSVTWDTTVKTSGFTAVSGNGYFCNTTSAAFTVTLPASPSAGDIVGIKDYLNTADTNNITIGRNSSNIQGDATDFIINTEGRSVFLVYVDGTKGWLVTSSSQASDISAPKFTVATGGTITNSGDFKIHTFTGPGTFCVSQVGEGANPSSVDHLVIAGGGSGGGSYGGGGGAGGFRTSFPSPAGVVPVSVQGYPITVGGGGASISSPCATGNNGSNSVFSSITSTGGGGGAPADKPSPAGGNGASGNTGGSGGGGATSGGTTGPGGAGNTPPVSPSQGSNGGNGTSDNATYRAGGGGGGASAVGGNGVGSPAFAGGPGGNGTANSINGSSVTRSGGGGGSSNGPARAPGGSGGGGAGGFPGGTSGIAGTANTGGGGGSTHYCSGSSGAGGSGIVIIRYKFQ